MIAQVDEDQVAMIALAVHPSGHAHLIADFGRGKSAASMSAIGVHGDCIFQLRFTEMTKCRSPAMGGLVKH